MGRKRTKFCDTDDKILKCITCGKEHTCTGDAVSVQCDICLLGLKNISNMSGEDMIAFDDAQKAKQSKEEVKTDKKNKILHEEVVGEPKVKRGRGRPRKNPILPPDKKGNIMANEKVVVERKLDVNGSSGKRGRKATVGTAVLGYIKSQSGDVKFADILTVYSAERSKLGKKASDAIEARNCHSTLYVMVRDGKLREVTKKSVYSAL